MSEGRRSGPRTELIPAVELDALLLFAWADFSYAEIGQALEIPVGTVRSRLSRARARVRAAFEPEPARTGTSQSATREVTDERD